MIAPTVLLAGGALWWWIDPARTQPFGLPSLILGFGVVVLGAGLVRDLILKARGAASPKVLQGGSCTL